MVCQMLILETEGFTETGFDMETEPFDLDIHYCIWKMPAVQMNMVKMLL